MPRRTIVRQYFYFAILLLFCGQAASCTRAELEHKTDAYNQAIAESNNRQILLNAVRASQRAPMSFVGFGSVTATPNFSGSASSTFNFDPFGITSYNANPSVNVGGGFSNFSMDNLNNADFAKQLQRRIRPQDIRYFEDLRFPKELLGLIMFQEYRISAAERSGSTKMHNCGVKPSRIRERQSFANNCNTTGTSFRRTALAAITLLSKAAPF